MRFSQPQRRRLFIKPFPTTRHSAIAAEPVATELRSPVYVRMNGRDASRRNPGREVRRYILHDPILPGAPVIMPTPEPQSMSLRTAFLVVILLHVVAIVGIYSFNKIKTRDRETKPVPVAQPPPQIEETPAPTPIPKPAGYDDAEPLMVFSRNVKSNPEERT